jgi:site-specific DNA-methyltransferase (adenine-specific)
MKVKSEVFNCDCMELMAKYPDGYFELAIVDPPYGIGISKNPVRKKHKKKSWDNNIPEDRYFKELFRVSKNQIIFGGNYFELPPSQGFIVWDKVQPENFSLAMCEYAWSSIQRPAKIWRKSVLSEQNKIHPTQKPVALYKWLLDNYAKEGDKILDTHLGSGSSRIACYDFKFDFVGCELDKDYFDLMEDRFKKHISQLSIFDII